MGRVDNRNLSGIEVRIMPFDTDRHKGAHLHAYCSGQKATIAIETGEVLDGTIHPAKMRILSKWMKKHKEALLKNWELAKSGKPTFRIKD
ncbi:MAG: DUF4160 domain-containing protein [bacterium]